MPIAPVLVIASYVCPATSGLREKVQIGTIFRWKRIRCHELIATVWQYCATGRINVEQREVYFSGMVQGVGFRYTAQRIASRYQVTGYVRNLPDGRVHLVAEGDPQELDQFIAEICQQMEGYIKSVETRRLPATGQFARFFIKH
ncbi:MAG: acylphosphatase [Thermogutta sp.]